MAYSLANRRSSQNKLFDERKRILVSAVGGEVFTSGSYKYHVFKSTSAFYVLWKSSGSLTFDYAVVGGSNAGESGSAQGAGGSGGNTRFNVGYSSSFDNFSLRTNYTVTVGGAGSHSTIATNSTTITSVNNYNGSPGGGGLAYASSPGCVTEECNDTNCTCPGGETCVEECCCYDCSGDGVTCCDDGGTPQTCCRGECEPGEPGYACGYSCSCPGGYQCDQECNCVCEQCVGDGNTNGGNGSGGVTDTSLTQFGPQGSSYNILYGQAGGGGGGGGNNGGLGGSPNGGNGGSPASNGTNGAANTGIGGGGGGGAASNAQYCSNTSSCTAVMMGGGGTNAAGAGGLGASGIVFIRYKFQE